MNNTEKRLEQKAQELTDYCFARGMTVSKLTFNHFIETIHQAPAEERERMVGEIEKTPIDKAHTYSSENADEYRAFDNGQESYKQKILSSLDKPDKQNWQLCIHLRKDVNKPLKVDKEL